MQTEAHNIPQPEQTELGRLEVSRFYEAGDSDKVKMIKTLKALMDPENFSEMAPSDRQRPGDKTSKVTSTFFLAVKDVLLLIVGNKMVSTDKSERLLKDIAKIHEMLADRDKISRIKKPTAELAVAPDPLKESFKKVLDQAVAKFAGQPDVSQNEVINSAISSLDPDMRMQFLLFAAEGMDDTRIPIEGEMPQDIKDLAESQVSDINRIIDSTLRLLQEDEPVKV
jgi:hypothetical protein